MTEPAPRAMPAGIAWQWSYFVLGALYALPALVVIPFAPTAGVALAIGVLPVTAFPLPGRRGDRRIIPVIGAVSAASMTLGSLLTQVPAVAVCAVFLLCIAFSLWARRTRVGAMAIVLCLPLVGIGLSYDDIQTSLVTSALMLLGSLYACGVALLWPEHAVPRRPAGDPPTRGAALGYGVLLGCAAATAAAVGYLLHLEHVGWVTGAALLVMRPARDQLMLRSSGRALSVACGALAAAALALAAPPPAVLAVVVALVLAGLAATQGSRWYIAPAFTSFIALTLILQGAGEQPGARFVERVGETVLGIGVALLFGAAVPTVIRAWRQRTTRGEDAAA